MTQFGTARRWLRPPLPRPYATALVCERLLRLLAWVLQGREVV